MTKMREEMLKHITGLLYLQHQQPETNTKDIYLHGIKEQITDLVGTSLNC